MGKAATDLGQNSAEDRTKRPKLPIQEAACRKKRKRGLETRTSVGLTKVQGQWEPKKSAAKPKKTHPKEEDLSEEKAIAWVKVGKEGS